MNHISQKRIATEIRQGVVEAIDRHLQLNDEARVIDAKQAELDALSKAYHAKAQRHELEFDSMIELSKVHGNLPGYLTISTFQNFVDYHPSPDKKQASDLVMKQILNGLKEEEKTNVKTA